ncbi:TetR/AcrR family transcriptional regulator C-terminal domain-containing protein [Mycolicibacterium goodii]|uniref:TetR/AcrR family transcriptional regulator C-terminal domain-containing protein n=1 Tax=Mycolicibacterium goodii TaxID=134601 RepID=A0ABS6HJ32_MYCGD|nr:TetR/AcrR family transcriptional regulator C-terminal domain-containing protein [Mycolicibacterium goodii]OKH61288.1 TetR family transcriptional regulator [Mycobacterium sp. SWH-M5]MBU8811598.1 TetR/AcrR family transcriptional regulator C-terminal domain-containing protein [Mycolicibacterium goodii]MBU8815227.1 TetR/AcrR family transcriptional regulator C-terminal domain-containing protein [Mycolicibacterium goodii]MBU8822243.1 TetR/AcrR family transcriptional regulator C-terminal domain-con
MQLHKPDVVAAATKILDDHGIADLTMRRLARELDVTPGALYWHFANKQELLGAVADHILQAARVDTGNLAWRDKIHESGRALRDALLSHTDGAELVSASFAAGESTVISEIVDRLAGAARDAGVNDTDIDAAARTVVYYVLGFTVDEQSRLQWDAVGALGDDQSLLTRDNTRQFRFGLQLLIDGLAAQGGIGSESSSAVRSSH